MNDEFKKILSDFEKLKSDLQNPVVLANPEKLKNLSKSFSELEEKANLIIKFQQATKNLAEAQSTLETDPDDELKTLAEEEVALYTKEKKELEEKLQKLMAQANPLDKKDIIVENIDKLKQEL